MNNYYISELQSKEVVSLKNGLNYGKIVDLLIDNEGKIINFVVQSKNLFKKNFKNGEIIFKYNEIEKIGKDVILVRV